MFKELTRKIQNSPFWKKLIKNMFSAAAGEAGSSVLNVITTILMIKALGNYSYGLFTLSQSFMNIVDGIINFQSWAAVIKYGSERLVNNDKDGLQSIIKLGTIVDFTTAAAGLIIAIIAAPTMGHIFNWSEKQVLCSAVFSLEIIFHFSGTSIGVLRMFNHFNLVAIQKISVALLKCLVISSMFINRCEELLYFVIAYVCADIVGHLMLTIMSVVVIIKSKIVSIKGILHSHTKNYARQFWTFAFWSNLATSIDIPVKQFDVFIMSTISYELVAVYKVYKQIGTILVELSIPISQSIMPQFSELVARGKVKDCLEVINKIHRTILAVLVPFIIIFTVISPKLLLVVFGELHAEYFYVLALYLLIRTYALSYVTVHQLFTSMGLVKEDFLVTGFSNIVYLCIALFLSKWLGILGIVVALGIQIAISINSKMILIKKNTA